MVPAAIEAELGRALGLPPAEAAATIAAIAHRTAAALHGIANREGKSRKGTAEWGRWARLTNASRALVLQASSCREAAQELAQDLAIEQEHQR